MEVVPVKPKIWNFEVVGGEEAWKEVVYSARVSGIPPEIDEKEVFRMMVQNDYGSALEHIIVKFNVKMSKGNAPELLEHRMASHTGYSTRFVKVDKRYTDEEQQYEIIVPWHLLGREDYEDDDFREFMDNVGGCIEYYDYLIKEGFPRESARYVLPFCQAVGIYHMTWNLRSLLNFLSLRLCTVSNALICMSDCTKKYIKDIKVGDRLLTHDTENKKLVETTVTQVSSRWVKATELCSICTSRTRGINVTREHPIYVINKGWVSAKNISIGDMLPDVGDTIRLKYHQLYPPMNDPKTVKKVKDTISAKVERGEWNRDMEKPLAKHLELLENDPIYRGQFYEKLDKAQRASRRTPAQLKHLEKMRSKITDDSIKRSINALRDRPSGPEKRFQEIAMEMGISVTYVGDGNLVIGGKNPDFVLGNAPNKLIEISDSRFLNNHRGVTLDEYESERVNHFAKYNKKCLVIDINWNLQMIKERLFNYALNGKRVNYVLPWKDKNLTPSMASAKFEWKKGVDDDYWVKVYNLECSPYPSYIANNILIHNCVRSSPEMRCLASQIYFELTDQLPILRNHVGCRGFMNGICPEEGVTGVRIGKQHPIYPKCPFVSDKTPKGSITNTFIPTRYEVEKRLEPDVFDHDKAVEKMEKLFARWAKWEG